MDGPARVVPLTIELEAALLRELAAEYNNLSWAFFSSRLQQPTIELVDSAAHLGRWVPRVRTIELSRAFVLTRPWGVVVEVLKHEMAHQAVEDLLGVRDETAHGPAFRLLCQQLGIDPSARGEPSGASVRDEAESRVLERVAKLLALAESSNEHEAQAAMSAAQKLLLKYNLDTAVPKGGRAYGFRHVGRATGRVSEAERLLAAILGEHFFVQVIWVPIYRPYDGKRGRVLELCGTPANLDFAEYVHGFLSATSERLWAAHKRAAGLDSDRDRRAYLAGVMTGFLEKLRHERKVQRATGLVWVGDADLGDYYRRRHPRISHTRFGGPTWNEARASGHAAGKGIVLHRPVEGAATNRGRLLGR
jgi:predicted SprT family Zn-dependent metalloprotease